MSTTDTTTSLGSTWFQALASTTDPATSNRPGSLLTGTVNLDGTSCAIAAIIPDPHSAWPRARHGEVGLAEGLGLAAWVRSVPAGTPIVMVIDVPSQAYGYIEELFGLHQALAASVEALAEHRLNGGPVISVVVGAAISGAFLATGLQANRIVALDHDGIQVQVMSKASTARITRRTITELDEAAKAVPATAYDGASFQRLGAVSSLVTPQNPTSPTDEDVRAVLDAVAVAVRDVQGSGDKGLGSRLASDGAKEQRALSIAVREAVDSQW